MPTLRAEDLDGLARACLRQVGVPPADAALVAEHLVEAGLMGHDTHSVLRLPQYVNMVRDGQVEPGAALVVLDESECGGRLNGQWNYGPVTATEAMRWALDKLDGGAVAVVGVARLQPRGAAGAFRRDRYPRRLHRPDRGQWPRRRLVGGPLWRSQPSPADESNLLRHSHRRRLARDPRHDDEHDFRRRYAAFAQ